MLRKRAGLQRLGEAEDLEALLAVVVDRAELFALRQTAVTKVAGLGLMEASAQNSVEACTADLQRRGGGDEGWLAGALGREARAIQERLRERESVLRR